MKKVSRAVLMMALVLSITTFSAVQAQENKPADNPERVGQNAAGNSGASYVIGPEDVLLIYVWKEDSLTRTVPVRIDGKISLPLVDDLQAAGLTPLQLKDALATRLKTFIDNPTVTVTVMETNSYKVYVFGEVKQPGMHRIRSEVTLAKLIIMVGGFTEWANQRNILIIKKDTGVEKRIMANYKKIVNGEESDIAIDRGDTVIVRSGW